MRDEKGFTLVELLVAMAVAGIAMTGIYSVYYSQQKSHTAQEEVAEMQQNLRAAMYFMAKDIRMAGCNPTGTASAGFVTANSNDIRFTMDTHGQATTDAPNGTINNDEDIRYYLSGNDLIRETGDGSGATVAENIQALSFAYLDPNGTATTSLLSIRSVQVTLTAQTGRPENVRTETLTTRIKCRNMGLL